MACLHPILIWNRRYYNQPEDYVASQLILHPEDVARQRLLVPCGHCPECLRAERNDWYVRLNREYAYQQSCGSHSWFFTLTISPKNYSRALDDPSGYVRSFFERIRHVYKTSVKHALFQEFSPSKGRLHFHGVLFGCDLPYRALHSIAKDFGFIYIRPVNTRSMRYCVKYIVKDIDVCRKDGRLLDKKYRRKFVSPGIGRFIGSFPLPSFMVRKWQFTSVANGRTFRYRIPRYYDYLLSEKERCKRSTFSAFLVSKAIGNDFASRVVLEALQNAFGDDWKKHCSDESLRKFEWAQCVMSSYRSALSSRPLVGSFPSSFLDADRLFESCSIPSFLSQT